MSTGIRATRPLLFPRGGFGRQGEFPVAVARGSGAGR